MSVVQAYLVSRCMRGWALSLAVQYYTRLQIQANDVQAYFAIFEKKFSIMTTIPYHNQKFPDNVIETGHNTQLNDTQHNDTEC